MLNKQQIDKSFTQQLTSLRLMINSVKYKKNRAYINTDVALSECYIHINNIDEIKDEKHLQSIIVNFLNKSIMWYNSKLNKVEKITAYNDKIQHFDEFNTGEGTPIKITKNVEREDTEDLDFQQKVLIEKWFDEKNCVLEIYRAQEQDKIKQIIYDCYFKKHITKGVRLAEHLGINKDYACAYLRAMKQDIRDFYKDYNNNNKL
jgi:hypothetical protein